MRKKFKKTFAFPRPKFNCFGAKFVCFNFFSNHPFFYPAKPTTPSQTCPVPIGSTTEDEAQPQPGKRQEIAGAQWLDRIRTPHTPTTPPCCVGSRTARGVAESGNGIIHSHTSSRGGWLGRSPPCPCPSQVRNAPREDSASCSSLPPPSRLTHPYHPLTPAPLSFPNSQSLALAFAFASSSSSAAGPGDAGRRPPPAPVGQRVVSSRSRRLSVSFHGEPPPPRSGDFDLICLSFQGPAGPGYRRRPLRALQVGARYADCLLPSSFCFCKNAAFPSVTVV